MKNYPVIEEYYSYLDVGKMVDPPLGISKVCPPIDCAIFSPTVKSSMHGLNAK